MLQIVILTVAGYLVGAVPFALLISRLKGVDIRQVGSGNVGATNVFRMVGKGLGVLTFACDVFKGFLPAYLFPQLLTGAPQDIGLLFGCAAIAGHNWPVYLRFKGGKGVATSVGVLLGVAPPAVGIGLAAWIIVFALTRYVSLASIAGAVAVPAAGWWLYGADGWLLPSVLTVLGLLVVWRHRSNIQRLLNGTEHQFKKKRTAEDTEVHGGNDEQSRQTDR